MFAITQTANERVIELPTGLGEERPSGPGVGLPDKSLLVVAPVRARVVIGYRSAPGFEVEGLAIDQGAVEVEQDPTDRFDEGL